VAKNQELDNLDRLVKDYEIRINTSQIQLAAVQKELDELANVEKQLEENIKYLKKKKVAVIASEFKKAKDDLTKTKNRMAFLRIERDNQCRVLRELTDSVKSAKERLVKILKGGENNVILGKFRKKNG